LDKKYFYSKFESDQMDDMVELNEGERALTTSAHTNK
jgi:hypothetical protein